MNFNRQIFWIFVFLALSTPVSAQQLTKADIDVLSTRLSNLDATLNKIDQRLARVETTVNDINNRLGKLETRVDELDSRLTNKIDEQDNRLTNKIEELDKRLTSRIDVLFWAIGSLIGIVLAVIVLPQVLGYFQDKRERENFQKQLADLQQQVQRQQREIEEIKSRRIVS